ncbi:MAG: glycoside hydrolase family 97 catalytic domain-containing protein [Fermentimonas sp.]|nr:glycoside hydrolase family 97 catalytic domain-containing protein [Fermentimonas sp.]NLC86828.1 glycoside hydrolase family 97 protein [Bacteroidales bacterium]HBT85924.1 alpha-glucosidase [Porphyromonadaceae bacterium]MDD2930939.1 glycoside hydrolase family 97 catalytic domain-containing protein [Fermentimonas sp.]MDD3510990.1 glycoside hydrolase family 97 catalytic domain-containing protein [Fermentimonas sp.]
MKQTIILLLLISFLSSCKAGNDQLESPNGKIIVHVNAEQGNSFGQTSLTISYIDAGKKRVLFENLLTGLKTDKKNLTDSMRLISISATKEITEEYTMITGKKSLCSNNANEQTFNFTNQDNESINLIIRAYNDGITFRYQFDGISDDEQIIEESTTYPIAEGVKRWSQPYYIDYEGFYTLTTSGISKNSHWSYPLLLEPTDSVFALITEANIQRNQCGSQLKNDLDPTAYRVHLADEKLPVSGTWLSPWRVVIIGSLGDIVESTLITDVSEPSVLGDTEWINPGPSAWIYWAYNNGSNDYQIVKEYIDLAAEMNWPYNLIDWKWNEMGNGGSVDDAVDYANEKGIKTLLWYNSSTSWNGEGAPGPLFVLNEKNSRVNEYRKLKEMGVSGIKVDFFNGDGHKEMNYYIDLLEDAIDHELLINFHGATLPRGWQRTYPNLMTVEAVYGAEWYNNRPILTDRAARHNATLPFTRNVVGPMDYTPGTFSDSQHPHITSHGHELALTVVFESALQHLPDRPESYRSLPEPVRNFLSTLPVSWDETKLLNGYPGESVVLARRKGDNWFIGGLNGTDESRTLSFDIAELTGAKHTITLFKDGPEQRSFTIEEDSDLSEYSDRINIECLPRGGFAAIIK